MRKRALVSLLAAAAATTGVVALPAAAAAPAITAAAPTLDELRTELRAAQKAAFKAEDAYEAALAEFKKADTEAVTAEALATEAKLKADKLGESASSVAYEQAVKDAAIALKAAKDAQGKADELEKAAKTAETKAKNAADAVEAGEREKAEAHDAIPAAEKAVTDAEAELKTANDEVSKAKAALADAVTEEEKAKAQAAVEAAEGVAAKAASTFEQAGEALRTAERRFEEAAKKMGGLRGEAADTKSAAATARDLANAEQRTADEAKDKAAKAEQHAKELENSADNAAYLAAKKEAARLAGLATEARGKADKLKDEADKLKKVWDEAEARVKKAQSALDHALFPVKITGIEVYDGAVRYPARNTPLPITVYTAGDAASAVITCGSFTHHGEVTVSGVWEAGFYLEPGDPGKGKCSVKVTNTHGISATKDFSYDFRGAARFGSFNASPEPVRKGRTIKVSGTVQATNANGTAYGHLNGARVTVYFKAKGASSWVNKGTTTTKGSGAFALGVTAKKDGTWKAVYAGTSAYTAANSGTDYVDVR